MIAPLVPAVYAIPEPTILTAAEFDPVFTTDPALEDILNIGFASVTPDDVIEDAAASVFHIL